MTVALPIAAPVVLSAIETVGFTHVAIVPDTHQRTVLELIDETSLPVVRAATEDDVLAICAGLWMGGAKPLALIQQLGLFASVNALRAFTHDQRVPLAILAGMYGRDVAQPVDEDPASAVRLCLPLLDSIGVKHTLVDTPADEHLIAPELQRAFDEPCTSAVLLGAPTA